MCSERCCTFLEILLSVLLPPLGVFLRHGCCSCEFLICVILTILGYIPGMIYAIYVIVATGDRHRSGAADEYEAVA